MRMYRYFSFDVQKIFDVQKQIVYANWDNIEFKVCIFVSDYIYIRIYVRMGIIWEY